jgi:hypothetical protein
MMFFLTVCTLAMGQRMPKADSIKGVNKTDAWNKGWMAKDQTLATRWYSESASNGVIIQNSFPKGGRYTDAAGKIFGYRIFFTRVINEIGIPLELTIHFPADSFTNLPPPDSYFKLFLPPGTMTLDKEVLYDYGATGLESFLNAGLNKPTMFQRTINPQEEYLFYIGALFYQANGERNARAPRLRAQQGGAVRAELVLKEQNLFYSISIVGQFDSGLIPCGSIIFKK